jgi:hypothetical protein
MKILCLMVILMNFTVFMLEYRSGAFATTDKQPATPMNAGTEPIVLVSEIANPALPSNQNSPPANNQLTTEQPPEKSTTGKVQPDGLENGNQNNQPLSDEIIP